MLSYMIPAARDMQTECKAVVQSIILLLWCQPCPSRSTVTVSQTGPGVMGNGGVDQDQVADAEHEKMV